jgi:hypothetical protein
MTETTAGGSSATFIIALVIAVLIGLWASRIMVKKGRSAGAGWALGLLLGLVGVLIAALLSSKRPAGPDEPYRAPYRASDGRWYANRPGGYYIYSEQTRMWSPVGSSVPVEALSDEALEAEAR